MAFSLHPQSHTGCRDSDGPWAPRRADGGGSQEVVLGEEEGGGGEGDEGGGFRW